MVVGWKKGNSIASWKADMKKNKWLYFDNITKPSGDFKWYFVHLSDYRSLHIFEEEMLGCLTGLGESTICWMWFWLDVFYIVRLFVLNEDKLTSNQRLFGIAINRRAISVDLSSSQRNLEGLYRRFCLWWSSWCCELTLEMCSQYAYSFMMFMLPGFLADTLSWCLLFQL